MPEGVAWTEPTGGFLTWLTLPERLDTLALRPAALAAGVAYVPGPPFHVGDRRPHTLRLSFSHLTGAELETAVERLAGVVRAALEHRSPITVGEGPDAQQDHRTSQRRCSRSPSPCRPPPAPPRATCGRSTTAR